MSVLRAENRKLLGCKMKGPRAPTVRKNAATKKAHEKSITSKSKV
jgi:hypothetical protein